MSTSMVSVSFRPAQPTVDDGLAFAWLLDQAQEGYFRALLGRRAPSIVAGSFIQPGHELSYDHVTFAEVDGHVVGMVSGYASEVHRGFEETPFAVATRWRRLRMDLFLRLTRRIVRFIDSIPDGDFYIRAIAVDESQRGKGIGTRLFQEIEATARTVGSARLALDVAARNRGARRLYERLGMVTETESRRWFGIPNSNLIRMVEHL